MHFAWNYGMDKHILIRKQKIDSPMHDYKFQI